jgi:hypothetical protein
MVINSGRQSLTSVKRKPLNGWKRCCKSACDRIHVRPKHLLETLDEAKSGATAKVESLKFWQLGGIEDLFQNVAI